MEEVKLFTDGACSKNPGPGGCVCIMKFGEHRKIVTAGFKKTTNNRMELMAAIIGLEAMKRTDVKVTLHSDSKYVVDSINKGWVYNWEKNDFYNRTNADLFIRFLKIYRTFPNIDIVWVKGHSGHAENEDCDMMAVSISVGNPQTEDTGYKE